MCVGIASVVRCVCVLVLLVLLGACVCVLVLLVLVGVCVFTEC